MLPAHPSSTSFSFRIATFVAATAAASCLDPVHSDAVDELGGEAPGVPEGETHRPGQPCTTCHGGSGPSSREFSVAGTIYDRRNSPTASSGVSIVLTDSSQPAQTRTEVSNEAGNFYIAKDRWSPTFPLFVTLKLDGEEKKMLTRIGRNGGCAFCHYAPLEDRTAGDNSPTHMPPVYMRGK